MIYLIDNTIDGEGASPREIRIALERIQPDTQIITERFDRASLERIDELEPSHIILSGQSHPWKGYSDRSLVGVFEIIRSAEQPILGVCGGHQQIALAYGARVDLMERLVPGKGYEGNKRERGFFDVETNGEGIFDGAPFTFSVWHSHYDEVKELPTNFKRTATNQTCAIQAMQHNTRPLFGVQFHPELFDEDHPVGKEVLLNFLEI
jgi:GMP synthase (glutamine-hydrolysing)